MKSTASRAGKAYKELRMERGAVVLETALSAAAFFFILVTGFDMMRLGYNVMSAHYAVTKVMRQAILGGPGSGTDRGTAIENQVVAEAGSLGINISSAAANNPFVIVCSSIATPCMPGDPDNAGEENDLFSIHLRYPLHLFFGFGEYNVDVVAIGRNEPFRSV
jgi:hypothetical protein